MSAQQGGPTSKKYPLGNVNTTKKMDWYFNENGMVKNGMEKKWNGKEWIYLTLPHSKVSATTKTQNLASNPKPIQKPIDWYHNGNEWIYGTKKPPIVADLDKYQKNKCHVCGSNYDGASNKFEATDYKIHINGIIHKIAVARVKHKPNETPVFEVSSKGTVLCNVCNLEFDKANGVDQHVDTNSHTLNALRFVNTKSASVQELLIISGSKKAKMDTQSCPQETAKLDYGHDLKVPEKGEPKTIASTHKCVCRHTEKGVYERKEIKRKKRGGKREKKQQKIMAKEIIYEIIGKVVKSSIPKSTKFRPMFESTNTNVADSMICNLCGITWMASQNLVERNLAVKRHKMSKDHSRNEKSADQMEDNYDAERDLIYSDVLGQWLKDTLPKTKEILTCCLKTLADKSVICMACPMSPPMTKNNAENLHIQTERHIHNMPLLYGDKIEEMGWYPTMAEEYFKHEVALDNDTDVEVICVKEKEHNLNEQFYDNLESLDVVHSILNDILSNVGEKEENGCNSKLWPRCCGRHTEQDMWGQYSLEPMLCEEEKERHQDQNIAVEIETVDSNDAFSLLHLIQQKRETLEIIDGVLNDLISDIVDNEEWRLPATPVEDGCGLWGWIQKCTFCAKRHIGSKICTARGKKCKFCKKIGHLEKVHLEQDPTFRDTILSALNDNETGDVFTGLGMWMDYKPPKSWNVWKKDHRKTNLLILEI